MPVEHDTSHQNGQEDTGGGGSNVSTETPSQQPQQAPEPIATTIVNGTHPKVPSTADDQGRQESPKDPKKVSGVREPMLLVFQRDRKVVWLRASNSEETRKIPRCWSLRHSARRKTPGVGSEIAGEMLERERRSIAWH